MDTSRFSGTISRDLRDEDHSKKGGAWGVVRPPVHLSQARGGQSCSSGLLELRGFASSALATFEWDLACEPHARNRAGLRDVTFSSGWCGLV